jgi:early secretory antigenic target protein ESAT-6
VTRYHVDSEQVILAANQARATISRIQAEVQTLNSHLSALSSSWSGPAQSAFATAHTSWRSTQTTVEQSLQGLGEALGHAGRHYQEMEAANIRLFQP